MRPSPSNDEAKQASAQSVSFTGATGRGINLEIDKGTLIRLTTPADTVFVANPDIADIQVKSPRLIYLYGKKAGETVLYAVDADDNVLMNSRVSVSHDISAFRSALRNIVPDSGIDVSTVGDTLVLTGNVTSAAEAEDVRLLAARFAPGTGAVVNNLRVNAPNQVNLRVRVAEVSRDALKQFGLNWDAIGKIGGFAFGLATGSAVVTDGNFLSNLVNVRNNGTNSVVGLYNSKNLDLNGVIDALANENLVTVLAEPNLTAMSGETANFLAGGEFPVPVAQTAGSTSSAAAITVEFKKYGVSLAFTPTVMDGSRINLRVRPEVSQLSTVGAVTINGITIPGLITRRAETTVELASGQSFAIAGLLQRTATQDVSKLPFLGDIPILGALFKSDKYQRNETELVIVVTPYIVRPVSAKDIRTPIDGFEAPSDMQRILYGTTSKQQLPQPGRNPHGVHGDSLIGPAGFQLD